MNSERISQVFLTLVNAGVLLSVVLLIFELRQNRDIAIAEIRNDISRQAVEREMFQASPELASAMVKGRNGEELSEIEIYQLDRLMNITLQNFENIVYQYEAGMFTEEEFMAIEERLSTMNPSMLNYYKERTANYSASFQRIMARNHDIE